MNKLFQTPRRRLYTAAIAGGMAGLLFPPYFFWFLLPVPFFFLYGTLDKADHDETFRLGMTFAIVFYLFHTYWFFSFHPVALPFMMIFLGCVHGAVFYGVSWMGMGPFSFSAGWMIIQGILGYGYHAFPWSRLATSMAEIPLLIQPVRWLGEWGWGGLLVACFVVCSDYLINRRTAISAWVLILFVVGFFTAGAVTFFTITLDRTNRMAMLVQPSVESNFAMSSPRKQLRILNDLTEKHAREGDFVVWPETAVIREPFQLDGEQLNWTHENWKEYFHGLLEPGFDLLTGLRFTDPQPNKLPRLNGAALIEYPADPTAFYTKRRPVPGGEHLPFMGSVGWVRTVGKFFGTLGYRGGEKGGLIPVSTERGQLNAGVLICFEDAFSQDVRQQVQDGADLLINISNDSWSRSRASHWQHFYRARVRAVETGRMVLRNGNTGVSGFIDPLGRVDQQLKPYKRGTLRGAIVLPLEDTIHNKLGAVTPIALIVLFGLLSLTRSLLTNVKNFLDRGTPSKGYTFPQKFLRSFKH